ncbi:excalibur calcium-binding domain-containing protein [Novosphingobium indicum]|uniref:excalibur calcium-binding domain-containing protein n=1 Tax=Novosphingobium indicum TaxID=462949 RepID=UPI001E4DC9AF|nr:excalibur calcium-binding domain-containing protein [Novosphingobium indicum]
MLPVPAGPALAHGGGLNAEGCHTNRKTGEYHCHRSGQSSQSSSRSSSSQPLYSQPRRNGAYRNCKEARAAGAAPVYRGQPGYGPHLDRDGDGIGCE